MLDRCSAPSAALGANRRRKAPIITGLGVWAMLLLACNERFEFDVPSSSSTDGDGIAGEAGASGSEGATGAACAMDADCPLSTLRCNAAAGRCVQCIADADCPYPANPHCDMDLYRCVECADSSQCPQGQECDDRERRCVKTCGSIEDCDAGAHACDGGRCLACDHDFECNDPALPFCSGAGLACVACRQDAQCLSPLLCDVLSGRCVSCRNSTDCAAGASCDPASLTCVGN